MIGWHQCQKKQPSVATPTSSFLKVRETGTVSPARERCATRSAWATAKSVDDLEPHLAGGAGDDAEGSFIVSRIQIFRLCFDDIHDLFARHFPDLRLVRFLRTGGD